MKKFFREYAYCVFMGVMLVVCNISITSWKYWVFLVGMVVLVNIRPCGAD